MASIKTKYLHQKVQVWDNFVFLFFIFFHSDILIFYNVLDKNLDIFFTLQVLVAPTDSHFPSQLFFHF